MKKYEEDFDGKKWITSTASVVCDELTDGDIPFLNVTWLITERDTIKCIPVAKGNISKKFYEEIISRFETMTTEVARAIDGCEIDAIEGEDDDAAN